MSAALLPQGFLASSRIVRAWQCRRRRALHELPARAAPKRSQARLSQVSSGSLVASSSVSRVGLIGDVHAEARLAGHFLDHEEPAELVVGKFVAVDLCPRAFVDREIEAEEAQVRIDLRAEQRKLELRVELRVRTSGHRSWITGLPCRRRWPSARRSRCSDSASAARRESPAPVASRRAARRHSAGGGGLCEPSGLAVGQVWSLVMSLSCSASAGRVGIADALDFPELAEVAAAHVGRVFAPQQLARHLVIEPDHVRLDELRIGLEQPMVLGGISSRFGISSSLLMSRRCAYIASSKSGCAMASTKSSGLASRQAGQLHADADKAPRERTRADRWRAPASA